MRLPPFFRRHPRAQFPWGPVPHVLRVPARQVCDPVVLLVLMKPDDRLLRHSIQEISFLRLGQNNRCPAQRSKLIVHGPELLSVTLRTTFAAIGVLMS